MELERGINSSICLNNYSNGAMYNNWKDKKNLTCTKVECSFNNNHIINKPQLCTICQDTINKSEENFKCAHCDYQFHVECISKWLDCKHVID